MNESILICVYNFLKNILLTEFDEINIAVENDINEKKIKKKKAKNENNYGENNSC